MANLNYDGNIVNSAVTELNLIYGKWEDLISEFSTSTSALVSCNGFDKYVGGVDNDSFSSKIIECKESNKNLINLIRKMQVSILDYTQDENGIKEFLSCLSEEEYNELLQVNHDLEKTSAKEIFKGFVSTLATAGLGIIEGAATVLETAGDFVAILGCAVRGFDVIARYIATGEDISRQVIDKTMAYVSEKKVENLFNNFYENSEIGQAIKSNSLYFDEVRGVSKGVGYVAGSYLVGSCFANINKYAQAASEGLLNFSNGVESSWNDNYSMVSGFAYGISSVLWNDSKANIVNNLSKFAILGGTSSGIFNKAIKKSINNAVDSGTEVLVDPLFKSLYTSKSYNEVFEEEGGWQAVGSKFLVNEVTSGSSYVSDYFL